MNESSDKEANKYGEFQLIFSRFLDWYPSISKRDSLAQAYWGLLKKHSLGAIRKGFIDSISDHPDFVPSAPKVLHHVQKAEKKLIESTVLDGAKRLLLAAPKGLSRPVKDTIVELCAQAKNRKNLGQITPDDEPTLRNIMYNLHAVFNLPLDAESEWYAGNFVRWAREEGRSYTRFVNSVLEAIEVCKKYPTPGLLKELGEGASAINWPDPEAVFGAEPFKKPDLETKDTDDRLEAMRKEKKRAQHITSQQMKKEFINLAKKWAAESKRLGLNPDLPAPEKIAKRRMAELNDVYARGGKAMPKQIKKAIS